MVSRLGKQIWKQLLTVEQLNKFHHPAVPSGNTIMNTLGIQFSKIGEDFIEATMPVDGRTWQPYGLLHGGASVVLAETLGSFSSILVAGPTASAVGIEVSASHLRGVKSGTVTGRCRPIRLGGMLHVWEIEIHETGKEELGPVCHSKLTVIVKENANKKP